MRVLPGFEAVSSLTLRVGGNLRRSGRGVEGAAHSRTSVKSEEEGFAVGSRRHSE